MSEEKKVYPMQLITEQVNAPMIKRRMEDLLTEKAAARFRANVIELYTGSTTLAACNPQKVVLEALKAASLGLSLSRIRKEAAIVPYKNDKGEQIPTLIPEWRGLYKLAMNTGQYLILNAGPYYEGQFVSENILTGEIDMSGMAKQPPVLAGFFSFYRLKDGREKTMRMSLSEMQAYGARYGGKNPKWKTDFNAMGTKTMYRQIIDKFGPKSEELEEAMYSEPESNEDEVIQPNSGEIIDATVEPVQQPEEKPARKRRTKAEIEAERQPEQDVTQEESPVPGTAVEGEFEAVDDEECPF